MKKLFLPAMLLAGLVTMTGCSHEDPESAVINPNTQSPDWNDTITISLVRAMEAHIEPFDDSPSRTRGDISSSANRLDVWIIQGTDTTAVHQQSSDANFGTITITVNKQKEYTMKAVAHKCSSEATMKGGIVSFTEGEIKHTLYATHTFKPDTITTTLPIDMTRIVGMFKFDVTDSIPSKVKTMRFTVKNAPLQFQTSDSTGVAKADRNADFANFNRRADGSATFTVYVIPDDLKTQHTYDIEVSGLDDKGAAVESRTFTNVALRANYRTSYSGKFFVTKGASFSFSIGDWQDYDAVTF